MVMPLLPAFLVSLGAGAAYLGVIEGAAEATAALLKYLSGRWADRTQRLLPLAVVGYLFAAAARPFLSLARAPWQVLVIRNIDRVGKGIRTSPRDKLLAASAPQERLAEAFSFHRGMDHAGAALGPLVASALLLLWPGDLRRVFLAAAVPGALAVLVLFGVREQAGPPARSEPEQAGPPAGPRRRLDVVRDLLRGLRPGARSVACVGALHRLRPCRGADRRERAGAHRRGSGARPPVRCGSGLMCSNFDARRFHARQARPGSAPRLSGAPGDRAGRGDELRQGADRIPSRVGADPSRAGARDRRLERGTGSGLQHRARGGVRPAQGRQRRLAAQGALSQRRAPPAGALPLRARIRRAELSHHRQGGEGRPGAGRPQPSARGGAALLRSEHPRRAARRQSGNLLGEGGLGRSGLNHLSSSSQRADSRARPGGAPFPRAVNASRAV